MMRQCKLIKYINMNKVLQCTSLITRFWMIRCRHTCDILNKYWNNIEF